MQDVATLLAISKERVRINSVVQGSVVVIFSILPDANGRPIPADKILTTFAAAGVTLPLLGTTTATAATIPASKPSSSPTSAAATASSGSNDSITSIIMIIIVAALFLIMIGVGVWWKVIRSREPMTQADATKHSHDTVRQNKLFVRLTRLTKMLRRVLSLRLHT